MFVVFRILHSFEIMGSAPWQRRLLDVNATHSLHVHRHHERKCSTCWRPPSLQSSDLYSCKKSARLHVCAGVQRLCLFLPVRMSSVYAVNTIALSLCAPAHCSPLGFSQALSCFFLKGLGQSLTWSALCSQMEQDFTSLLAGLL